MPSKNFGIFVSTNGRALPLESQEWFEKLLEKSIWAPWVEISNEQEGPASGILYRLNTEGRLLHTPDNSTLQLSRLESLWLVDAETALEEEILIGLLTCPYRQSFPSFEELCSALRMRKFIAQAGQLTSLRFDTRAVDRPVSHWTYDEELGFLLRKDCSLIEALRLATQPSYSGKKYAFSCYRASEYVVLLGIAEEAKISNTLFYERLQRQWEIKAIASGAFHETFLDEHGSLAQPVPMLHYIPGDRVWFRNPDPLSSNVSGYEGSWVIYLGKGLFSNFWSNQLPFGFDEKCLEVYHWRDGAFQDDEGAWFMDESVVADKVRLTKTDPQAMADILQQMRRYREPSGVYVQGGCIDASRESPRFVRPLTCNMVLRDV